MKDELFEFEEIEGGYILSNFSMKNFSGDLTFTEITVPAEHEGRAVLEIGKYAFIHAAGLQKVTISEGVRRIGEFSFNICTSLRSVSLPSTLNEIDRGAFYSCGELREVTLRSSPRFGEYVFRHDLKLPAELVLAGELCSLDLTRPLDGVMLRDELLMARGVSYYMPWFCRRDVFALAAENDCFRDVEAAVLDELVEYTIRTKRPELTAYFLSLKNRIFGFTGDDLDL